MGQAYRVGVKGEGVDYGWQVVGRSRSFGDVAECGCYGGLAWEVVSAKMGARGCSWEVGG